MMRGKSLMFLLAMVVLGTPVAHAQYTAKEWPDGPSKQIFVDTCNGCHDINRVRGGYTPEGWLTVVRMMQNMQAPVPAEDWGPLTDIPHEELPGAQAPGGGHHRRSGEGQYRDVGRAHPGCASARSAGRSGRLDLVGRRNWPTSSAGSIPKTGAIREYTLKSAFTGPHGLVDDKAGNIWFTGNLTGLIGKLDPNTGIVTEYPLPDPNAKDPHTLNFDQSGILWFTVQQSNMVGRLDPATGAIKLLTSPTPKSRPYGHPDQRPGRSGLCRIRHQQDRHHRSEDAGDQGVHAAQCRCAAAAPRDRSRRHDLVRRLFAGICRQA